MKQYLRFIPFYVLVIGLILGLALWGDRAVTAMAENQPVPDRLCILVDAGHGYPDGGAVSCTGVHESVINLQISQRLDKLLGLLGYRTRMLRTGPDSVYTEGETIARKKISDLKERVRLVNGEEEAILLSIHQNHYSDSRYGGAQMFWADTEGSEALAKALQTAFVTNLNPGSSRQAKQATEIYLLEHIQCPAVLVECGFLSNPEEEARLRSPEYQKQISCVIACALSQFLSNT